MLWGFFPHSPDSKKISKFVPQLAPTTRLGISFMNHHLQLQHALINPSLILIFSQHCPTVKQITEPVNYIRRVTNSSSIEAHIVSRFLEHPAYS
jgi:hypothetical protein